jgi:ligand-binding sensor domain-containing protein
VSGGQQWTRINNGITNLYVGALWIDPRNPQQLWAGSVGRVYRSTDGGSNWQTFTTGLPAGIVTSLTGHPTDSSRLFAIVYGFGLYETRDGGSTWTLRSGSDIATGALALRVDPSRPDRLLVGTPHRGMQTSVDNGTSWQGLNNGMSLFVRSIASDPAAASTLYAATLGGGLFRSQDSAANWTNIGLAAGNVFRVRSPAANLLLVGTTDGISITKDAGTTWAALGQRTSFVHSMVAVPLDSRRVIVGGSAGQAWMPDASGTRWSDVGAGLPAADLRAMTRCTDNTVYAAVEGSGVWRTSMSAPGAWQNAGNAGLGTARVTSLACDPRSGFLYAGSNGSGLFLSMNGGANWTAINKGVVGNVISAVVSSPTTAWQLWAAVQDGTVYRSDDAGLNWIAANTNLPQGDISYLVAASDGTLYAAAGTAVYRRPASGGNWTPAAIGLPGVRLTALWADPSRSNVLLAGVAGRGLYMTTNGGTGWSAVATDSASADATAIAGGLNRIHVGTLGTGVAWSDNGGTQFGPVQAPDQIPQIVTDIAVDAADPNTIYLATGGQGVILSRDGGAHWRGSNTGLSSLSLLCLVAHPLRSGELYAGTHAGVFVSRDGGASWTALNQGLTNRNVSSLTFDKQIPDILYVGLEGGGIYFYDTRR